MIEELENIEGWQWGQLKIRFLRHMKLLRGYVKKYLSTPRPTDRYEGVNIGAWVSYQRNKYKNRKMSAPDIACFEAIKEWTWELKKY